VSLGGLPGGFELMGADPPGGFRKRALSMLSFEAEGLSVQRNAVSINRSHRV
jgi:hypothetical protein